MRIVKETTADRFKVTVFEWNNKFILKFEEGTLEATFKINQMDLTSNTDIELFLTDSEILAKISKAFVMLEEVRSTFDGKI